MTPVTWEDGPLAKHHDRRAFDCGTVDLNADLQRYARQNHESGGAKRFVATKVEQPAQILGCYTLRVPTEITASISGPAREAPRSKKRSGYFRGCP